MSYESEQRREAEAKANEKKYLSKEEIEKKIFKPEDDNETFRILPDENNETSFEIAYFHKIDINGFSQTVYCPKHNDQKDCPLCAEYERIKATQEENSNFEDKTNPVTIKNAEIYKKAVKYAPTKYYIFKGIDKGSPKDGVKFWRIKDNKKKEGDFDKIKPLIDSYYKNNDAIIADVEKGADLSITTVWDTIPANGRRYKKVSSVVLDKPSKLDSDNKKVEAWVKDKMTWREIFRPNTLPGLNVQQYLQAIIDDKIPVWDKETRKWVEKKPVVDEGTKIKKDTKDKSLVSNVEDITPTTSSSDVDDLPF